MFPFDANMNLHFAVFRVWSQNFTRFLYMTLLAQIMLLVGLKILIAQVRVGLEILVAYVLVGLELDNGEMWSQKKGPVAISFF